MDSNLARYFRGLRSMRLSVVAGAQTTKVHLTRLRETFSLHPLCNLQYFLPPASPPQTTDVQGTSNRSVRGLAKREHGGLNLDPNLPSCEILLLM